MEHWKEDRVTAAERGENPTVLARMRTGWAVIGDTQHLPGYCLLLYADSANHLTDLPREQRARFLLDLSLLGEAVEVVCGERDAAFRRLNYEVLGNSWEHLHGHIHPRYEWEPSSLLHGPVWRYGEERTAPEYRLGPQHDDLREDITRTLTGILSEAYERSQAPSAPPLREAT
ncbi:HIT family protein [Streptomyces sp. NPDC058665]|uniref:HIT family protein n=1 Tax=Streptomyces sp. NPDC058665 TaxID=3346586 RepID=UPI00365BB078